MQNFNASRHNFGADPIAWNGGDLVRLHLLPRWRSARRTT
jgi:hypothetical protein